ncbi:hypothetical protein [Massilia glaciei]|uniref:SMI1/KNR4 family protein n=1 Tax=Massilia glaciei TaxID=1524097 RepID=A0A2U2H8U0_9BURK|nr:hypothetical protein [Massilia glaciei]PWF39030.1 hypothetical protein C7C56_027570 [Massilia glaciei]
MPWFPIVADHIDAVEAQLGIALPQTYKGVLLEPRVAAILSDRLLGAFEPDYSMADFAGMTRVLRDAHPEFPRDAVVAFCGQFEQGVVRLDWGYWRFWLPEKNHPERLGDTLFCWNLVKRKKNRDASTLEWLTSYVQIVDGDDSTLLHELGYAAPMPVPELPMVNPLPCPADLLAQLSLRGPALAGQLCDLADSWLPCAQMKVQGNCLCPRDLGQEPSTRAGESVKVGPGVYEVSVRLCQSGMGEWPIVHSVRVLLKDAAVDERTAAFTVDVDMAAVCVFDRQALLRQVPVDGRDDALSAMSDIAEKPCLAVIGKNAQALIVASGDGTYPVFRLAAAGVGVGLEIVFVAGD